MPTGAALDCLVDRHIGDDVELVPAEVAAAVRCGDVGQVVGEHLLTYR
jgi:hypothetical protein